MTSAANKHYHVEYNELNGCHFNPIAEEFEDEVSTHTIIRLILKLIRSMSSPTYAINFDSFFSPYMSSTTQMILRKGGCFVSICRGISVFMGLLVFLFILSFTIFFSTKYAYEVS
jgi:hypothetical protein